VIDFASPRPNNQAAHTAYDSRASFVMRLTLIAKTEHSDINVADGTVKTIVKRSRRVDDPRTLVRWREEVDTLQRIGPHVSTS
jgi:hypothetical protein